MNAQGLVKKFAIKTLGAVSDPMVFAHGMGCDQTMWKDVAPAFVSSNKVILFDLMGFGNSDRAGFSYERYQTLNNYADDFVEIAEQIGLEPVTFVGHSVSAIIGVLAAKKRPDLFKRLVLIGPSPRYINDGEDYYGGFEATDIEALIDAMRSNYLGWAQDFAPLVMGNPDRPEFSGTLEASFCRTNPVFAEFFAALTFWGDNRADLADVITPSLIIQCSDDLIAPRNVGRYIDAKMQNATLVELIAAGHCPHMSHPTDVIREIRNYVGSSATIN
ncbi:alpha/beta fold hydrolase [Rhabdaerophilum calidifontis]|uniref:alpha/beta fold hydrolase n=1 Tax=Rhabdaerophilum calidifontis TaxID=2604328 RepID=UPI001238A9AD|nr:alpha/beta hydrolase [Rhabdaerophilum calidifontis]